jgi:hypothetical protein
MPSIGPGTHFYKSHRPASPHNRRRDVSIPTGPDRPTKSRSKDGDDALLLESSESLLAMKCAMKHARANNGISLLHQSEQFFVALARGRRKMRIAGAMFVALLQGDGFINSR